MQKVCALLGCCGILLLPVIASAAPRPSQEGEPASRPVIAVSEFPGEDKSMGSFLSETLLTDLGHSDQLQTLERSELKQALADLDMPVAGPVTPAQVRHLGELIHASRIIIGSYLVRDDQVVINARMLDTQSGLTVPGGAFNVTGSRKALLSLSHKLSRLLCRRLTGAELALDEEGEGRPIAAVPERVIEPVREPIVPEEIDPLDPFKQMGLIPLAARPNGILAERDLAALIGKLAKRLTPSDNAIHLTPAPLPVSRLQALAAMVKLVVSVSDMHMFRGASASLTPDASQIPMWGQPYVAAAIDQGWWDGGEALRPRENTTWGFIRQVLNKLPLEQPQEPTRPAPRRTEVFEASETYTGLVIDARDFDLKRDHSPRIVDEDGNEVYPDPKHVPNPDYVEEHGMAAYSNDEADTHRSGGHPLIVRAIAVAGPGPFDVVVTNEDARRIVEANRRSKFLWKWNVTLLIPVR